MVGGAKLRTEGNTGHEGDAQEFLGECEKGELGCVCGHADDRRGDTTDLMVYNYEGSYRVVSLSVGRFFVFVCVE